MLDEAEIRKEIARLEYEESSYPNYAKLANLYTIRNQMSGTAPRLGMVERNYSGAMTADVVGKYGDSDFLKSVAGKQSERIWPIIDELMDTLAMVNRKVYDSIMGKIRNA